MLTLIQKKKKSDLAKIDSFLELLKDYQKVDALPWRRKKATFLIAENEESEVYGGAFLYPLKIAPSSDQEPRDLYERTLCKVSELFQPQIQEIWMARVCICLREQTFSVRNSLNCLRQSYSEMYKELIAFGEQRNLEFLAFTLNSASSFANLLLGEEWPGRTEITYSGSSDRLCHGTLSVRGKTFIHRKTRKEVDHISANENGLETASHRRAS